MKKIRKVKNAVGLVGQVQQDMTPSDKNTLSVNMQLELFDKAHPVGSFYTTTSSENPSILFGGTWESIPQRIPVEIGENYILYSDGWYEEWNETELFNVDGVSGLWLNYTLKKSFRDKKYNIYISRGYGGTGYSGTDTRTDNFSTNEFRLFCYNEANTVAENVQYFWKVEGYTNLVQNIYTFKRTA